MSHITTARAVKICADHVMIVSAITAVRLQAKGCAWPAGQATIVLNLNVYQGVMNNMDTALALMNANASQDGKVLCVINVSDTQDVCMGLA